MRNANPTGRLYVVATPIGNLGDITLRALEVLKSVDLIAAEDTRHSRVLLAHHGIDRPALPLHEHNEEQQARVLVDHLLQGRSVALISDAGTPLVSDPGFRLIGLAVRAGIDIVSVPGASAVTAALSISGLPTDRIAFEGFLPARAAARRNALEAFRDEPRTLVFFESSHRILDCLADLAGVLGGGRRAAVCRELTKQFETVLRGTLTEILERVRNDPDQRRGEFVVVVEGGVADTDRALAEAARLARDLQASMGASQAARTAARHYGVSRRAVYEALEEQHSL